MSSKRVFVLGFIAALTTTVLPAQAGKNYQIFDVRRNLAMNAKDAITRDYYVNAGTQDGLKAGMVLSVYRRDPIFDAYDDIRDDLYAPVGQIKLIHVQRTLSIARLVGVSKSSNSPIIDFRAVMIGDRIDLKSATMGEGGGAEGLENGDSQGAAAPTPGGGTNSAVTGAPSAADSATAGAAPQSPKASETQGEKGAPKVSKNTPPAQSETTPQDTKSDAKKVPDAGSLFTEENKPTLNTQ